jgi:hypothetical protein
MAWAQLSAGTSQLILTDTTTALPHLKVWWLHLLWGFLKEIDAEIESDHDQVLQIQRQYDEHIMDNVLIENAFTNKEINCINNCRLYLQAVTIADICTVCGTIFDPFFLKRSN